MTSLSVGNQPSSLLAAWQAAQRLGSAQGATGVEANAGGATVSTDSLNISPQALALWQAQQAVPAPAHHQMGDDRAARIGARMQGRNAALFKQLDQDGDGKLTAAELQQGVAQVRQKAHDQATALLAPLTHDATASAAPGASTGTSMADQATRIGALIKQKDAALFKRLDQDGDGKLSAAELKQGIDQLGQDAAHATPDQREAVSKSVAIIQQAYQAVTSKR